jgi:hypothetical protein
MMSVGHRAMSAEALRVIDEHVPVSTQEGPVS